MEENGMWIYKFSDHLESINLRRLNVDKSFNKSVLFQIFKNIRIKKEIDAALTNAKKSSKKEENGTNNFPNRLSKEQYNELCHQNIFRLKFLLSEGTSKKKSKKNPNREVPIMRKNKEMEEI